jgi:hypothetical protein
MHIDIERPRVVVALFRDRVAAEHAIRALQDAGFSRDGIGVATRDPATEARLGEGDSKAAEGAATGALSGGALGGLVGLLVGVGALAIPGLGPVIAGGALATALGWPAAPRWPAPASARPLVGSSGHWSGWGFPTRRRDASSADSVRAGPS